MQVDIRLAARDDFAAVRGFDPHSKHIDPERVKTKLDKGEILLAWEEDEVVGMARVGHLWSTRPLLELVWVRPDKRGKGIGTGLLVELERWLVEQGHGYLLSSSQEGEERAREWHLKCGFRECGVLEEVNLPASNKAEYFYIKRIGEPAGKDNLKIYEEQNAKKDQPDDSERV